MKSAERGTAPFTDSNDDIEMKAKCQQKQEAAEDTKKTSQSLSKIETPCLVFFGIIEAKWKSTESVFIKGCAVLYGQITKEYHTFFLILIKKSSLFCLLSLVHFTFPS